MNDTSSIFKRRTCYRRYGYGSYYCSNSRWHSWGRWVLLACLIVAALFFFCLFSCINSRRRRARGHTPIYGTGWMAPLPKYSAQPAPGHQSYGSGQPQSQYQPQDGYYAPPAYGGENIQLQQPPQAYRGAGHEDYTPPPGPPPGK